MKTQAPKKPASKKPAKKASGKLVGKATALKGNAKKIIAKKVIAQKAPAKKAPGKKAAAGKTLPPKAAKKTSKAVAKPVNSKTSKLPVKKPPASKKTAAKKLVSKLPSSKSVQKVLPSVKTAPLAEKSFSKPGVAASSKSPARQAADPHKASWSAPSRPVTQAGKSVPSQLIPTSIAPMPAPDLLESDQGADPGFLRADEVFDETDYAQHLQLMEQADIARRAREMNRPQTHPNFDGKHCLECDIEMPPARLQAGRIRCVDCQEEVEAAERRSSALAKGRSI